MALNEIGVQVLKCYRTGHACAECLGPWDCGTDECKHGNGAVCVSCQVINAGLENARLRVMRMSPFHAARAVVASDPAPAPMVRPAPSNLPRLTPAQYRASLRKRA